MKVHALCVRGLPHSGMATSGAVVRVGGAGAAGPMFRGRLLEGCLPRQNSN